MSLKEVLSDASRSQEDIINAFTRPVNAAVETKDPSKLEEALSKTWRDLIQVACNTPHQEQERIATITKKIQRQPGPSTDDVQDLNVWNEPVSWERMTLLGPTLRDSWNWSPEDKNVTMSAVEWVNLNAFVARITAGYRPSEPFDYSLYGIWTLRTALEDEDSAAALPHDAPLQAAAVWLIYAAQAMLEKCQSNFEYDGKVAKEGASLKGRGWKGCSMERWQLWEERLKLAREKCSGREKTSDLLQEALAQMSRVAET